MELNRSGTCALRSLIYLAQQPLGTPVLGRDVAAELGTSEQCVTRVLRALVKRKVLISIKGRGGGFALRPGAERLSLYEVLKLIGEDNEGRHQCVLDLRECDDEHPCPLHQQWRDLQQKELGFLQEQHIAELASTWG
ncbi:RrF2 family transcriptional regulator [Acidithiobacillus sp.]|uniref:RrF2 family transcriptional regulator n=1 Tax=Acidithiobacillus sp. TaxID=1872118 RepID=UPI003D07A5AC